MPDELLKLVKCSERMPTEDGYYYSIYDSGEKILTYFQNSKNDMIAAHNKRNWEDIEYWYETITNTK
jgi:hypothetical protein